MEENGGLTQRSVGLARIILLAMPILDVWIFSSPTRSGSPNEYGLGCDPAGIPGELESAQICGVTHVICKLSAPKKGLP